MDDASTVLGVDDRVAFFENYLCNNNILAAFLGVDHSTITFYLYGKKYISKKQPKKV